MIYDARKSNEAFKQAMDDAGEQGTDVLEEAAFKRATEGVEEPVFFNGDICGHVRKYSDALLALLLKCRRYREDKVELSGPGGTAIVVQAQRAEYELEKLTPEELEQLRDLTAKAKCLPLPNIPSNP